MSPETNPDLKRIRFLLTDVDGVLTDGRLYFDHLGNEMKVFHVHDGAGFAYWHRAGYQSGFLSGRNCIPVANRAKNLGVHEVHLGHLDKLPVLEDIAQRLNLEMEEIAYIGDDLLDIPVLKRVGFAASVPNGAPETRNAANYITNRSGGDGAAREVIELILKAQDLWDDVLASDGLG